MQRFAAVAAASLVAVAWFLWGTPPASRPGAAAQARQQQDVPIKDRSATFAARDGEWLTVEGIVSRTLSDDRDGSRHQRFILRLDGGHTLLVSHNIDLAPRLEALAVGERLTVRGEYQSNERGGVVHWTHHDPDGSQPGGYIERQGRRYR